MDWNSDGLADIVSGDRYGNFNVFLRQPGGSLVAYYRIHNLLNGDSINVVNNSQPAVADWNRDGRKDLLLGSETGGIYLYLNQATDTWPLFQDYTLIEAGGSQIMTNRVNPYVLDLDQDGKRDLICGANDGYVYFYHNVGSDTSPTLAAGELLTSSTGTPIQPSGTYAGSRLGFGDWNNDGWPDFLISGFDGFIELWLGGPPTGVSEDRRTANDVRQATLECGPNPARSAVTLEYSLPRAADVRLEVFDAGGRRVANLVSGNFSAGRHTAAWNARCPAGVYLVRLTAGDYILTRQVTLLAD